MQRGTGRILSTHAGSLPRPDDLLEMLIAKDDEHPYDQERVTTRVHSAVAEVVQLQIAPDRDIINDGELSKHSFSTYACKRLRGFQERPLSADERPSMISGRNMPEFAEYFASRGGIGGTSASRKSFGPNSRPWRRGPNWRRGCSSMARPVELTGSLSPAQQLQPADYCGFP